MAACCENRGKVPNAGIGRAIAVLSEARGAGTGAATARAVAGPFTLRA
jgi:hypothetical protein